jgi:hypothetical protein
MQRMKPRRQKPGAAAAGADLDPFAPEYGVDTWHEAGAKAATNTQAALASEKVGLPSGMQMSTNILVLFGETANMPAVPDSSHADHTWFDCCPAGCCLPAGQLEAQPQ